MKDLYLGQLDRKTGCPFCIMNRFVVKNYDINMFVEDNKMKTTDHSVTERFYAIFPMIPSQKKRKNRFQVQRSS